MFHFNVNICWSDRKHCMQWNCTPEIVYSKLWQQEEPRCSCVLSCIFVTKSICYSFILLNFEFNLLYRLKISMLSNYAGGFSSATQIAMFGSRYTQWWQHTAVLSLQETLWPNIVSIFFSSLAPLLNSLLRSFLPYSYHCFLKIVIWRLDPLLLLSPYRFSLVSCLFSAKCNVA